MNKQQEAMLTKIALNKHSVCKGNEPETASDTFTPISYVIESPEDRAIFTSLLRFGWVVELKDIVGLTELGFETFEEL